MDSSSESLRLTEQVAYYCGLGVGVRLEPDADPLRFLRHLLTALRTAAATSAIVSPRSERAAKQPTGVVMSLSRGDPLFTLLGGQRAAGRSSATPRPTWAAEACRRLMIRGR